MQGRIAARSELTIDELTVNRPRSDMPQHQAPARPSQAGLL